MIDCHDFDNLSGALVGLMLLPEGTVPGPSEISGSCENDLSNWSQLVQKFKKPSKWRLSIYTHMRNPLCISAYWSRFACLCMQQFTKTAMPSGFYQLLSYPGTRRLSQVQLSRAWTGALHEYWGVMRLLRPRWRDVTRWLGYYTTSEVSDDFFFNIQLNPWHIS